MMTQDEMAKGSGSFNLVVAERAKHHSLKILWREIMTEEEAQETSPIQDQINRTTGITKTPEQIATDEGYILQGAVRAKAADGSVVTLPAGSRVRV
jgi:hypothetical protein